MSEFLYFQLAFIRIALHGNLQLKLSIVLPIIIAMSRVKRFSFKFQPCQIYLRLKFSNLEVISSKEHIPSSFPLWWICCRWVWERQSGGLLVAYHSPPPLLHFNEQHLYYRRIILSLFFLIRPEQLLRLARAEKFPTERIENWKTTAHIYEYKILNLFL